MRIGYESTAPVQFEPSFGHTAQLFLYRAIRSTDVDRLVDNVDRFFDRIWKLAKRTSPTRILFSGSIRYEDRYQLLSCIRAFLQPSFTSIGLMVLDIDYLTPEMRDKLCPL